MGKPLDGLHERRPQSLIKMARDIIVTHEGRYLMINFRRALHNLCLVLLHLPYWSRGDAVCIATGCGLYDRDVGGRFPAGSRIFHFLHHPGLDSCPVGAVGSFPGAKAACALS
jgi:hypothetical protein